MHKPFTLVVKPGNKTPRSSKEVIGSVLRGNALPEGDVGAYIVGVLACQHLTTDGRDYDKFVPGQWRHCLYKDEWSAALRGADRFTDEQKLLILAGYELLETYPHGWGKKAAAQFHVRKLLDSWRDQAENADTRVIVSNTQEAKQRVPPVRKARSRQIGNGLNREVYSEDVPIYDEVRKLVDSKRTSTLFDVGRAWLIECMVRELPGFSRDQVKVIIDLHLDPRNYVLDCISDYESIRSAILRGEGVQQVSDLLAFEDISTMLGVFRVHCRNAVNRRGVSDINQGGANSTKAPKVLAFLDSLDDTNWHSFDRIKDLAAHYIEVIRQDRRGVFTRSDLQSMTKARQMGESLQSTAAKNIKAMGIGQGWVKFLRCVSGGVSYLKQFDMNTERFMQHVSTNLKTHNGTKAVIKSYRDVPEIGVALAPNFFADLGFEAFCKPDTHVRSVVNSVFGADYSDENIFDVMLGLARESRVPPRKLDKVFYLGGSGSFYLINRSAQTGKWGSGGRKNSLIQHLAWHIKNNK